MTTYNGILHFFSETGTEGGTWAFQDEKFMHLPGPNQYACTTCGRVWDKDRDAEPPKPSFTYWRDDWEEDGKRYLGGYHVADTYDPNGNLGPGEFNQEFTRRSNETSKLCADHGHSEWKPMYPDGMWSYEGLHVLNEGDHLIVRSEGDEVLFDGDVKLPPRQDPYADDAYVAGGGLAAHRKPPEGTDEAWWFNEYRATLTTKERI